MVRCLRDTNQAHEHVLSAPFPAACCQAPLLHIALLARCPTCAIAPAPSPLAALQQDWYALLASAEFFFNDAQNEQMAENLRERVRYLTEKVRRGAHPPPAPTRSCCSSACVQLRMPLLPAIRR